MKAFNRLSAGLCLSVFLFCPVHGVWGQGAGESSWQLKGLVDTYHAFRSEKPNDWMSSRTRLRGEVGKNFAGSSLFVSFNATYNALLKERTGFELREAYLDHRQEHWGFRLGRQLVIWGAADGVRITDLVSPMDMTEFLAQDYDDIRNSPTQSWSEVMPGDIKYKDINGDGKIDTNDRVAIGATTKPNLTYGFGISAKWKGLDVNVHFQGAGKSTYFIEGSSVFMFQREDFGNIFASFANSNRWILGENEDPNAEYPRLSYGGNSNNQQKSTYWLRDGSYMRLKTLDIGYTLPTAWVNKAHLNKVRFFFVGTNLLTFAKFDLWDPEMGSTDGKDYPLSRTFSLGVSINL